MIVPWQQVPEVSLASLLEEFVSRDGTDYGEQEIPVSQRVAQVRTLLASGKMIIWFDQLTETISLFAADAIPEAN